MEMNGNEGNEGNEGICREMNVPQKEKDKIKLVKPLVPKLGTEGH